MPGYDDPFWRVLTDLSGINQDYAVGLPQLWDEVAAILGHPVHFLDHCDDA